MATTRTRSDRRTTRRPSGPVDWIIKAEHLSPKLAGGTIEMVWRGPVVDSPGAVAWHYDPDLAARFATAELAAAAVKFVLTVSAAATGAEPVAAAEFLAREAAEIVAVPAIADTVADPILVSRAHMARAVIKRCGYCVGAICRHCYDAVVILGALATKDSPWIHRDSHLTHCLRGHLRMEGSVDAGPPCPPSKRPTQQVLF